MMCKLLVFGCIAAVILMTAAYGAPTTDRRAPLTTELPRTQQEAFLTASICDLEQLTNIENNFLQFYTPNDKQECKQTTLGCYLRELKVLKQDVEGENRRHIINIEKNLSHFKIDHSSNSTCKKCESNEKKKIPEFLQELKSFLQSMLKEIV